MTDLDPAIWDNPTLGDQAHNENLERLEKQRHEDRNARVEGREPRPVILDRTYPGWQPEVQEKTGTVPSNYQAVHFADEEQNDVPVDSGPEGETAGALSVENEEEKKSEVSETEETASNEPGSAIVEENEVETTGSDSTEESDSTKWN